jgi:hypothetical protein
MRPHTATGTTTRTAGPAGWVCPECGEAARRVRPTTLVPYTAHGLPVPDWSHADGEPLCPVIGATGYQPTTPVPAQPQAA